MNNHSLEAPPLGAKPRARVSLFEPSIGVPIAHWFIIWDSVMREDVDNLEAVLSLTGWSVKSSDNWELYDVIARFKRWSCMKVVLSKVPVEYLRYRYAAERGLPYGKVLMGLIRKEAHKRSYITVVLQVLNLPDDIIGVVWSYLL